MSNLLGHKAAYDSSAERLEILDTITIKLSKIVALVNY